MNGVDLDEYVKIVYGLKLLFCIQVGYLVYNGDQAGYLS